MTILFTSWILIFSLLEHIRARTTTVVNVASVLEQYIAVCGTEYLCSQDNIQEHFKSNSSYKSLINCPKCSCDTACLLRQDCCPDLYLDFPLFTCKSVDIELFIMSSEKVMISADCPVNSDKKTREMCLQTDMSAVDRVLLPPVTETESGYRIPFQNKYCAVCNGFTDYDEWIINITCPVFADFNYLSSYKEIIELATEKMCVVSFYPQNSSDAISCKKPKPLSQYDTVIDTCNTTGFWTEYDRNINMLCTSPYNLHYEVRYSPDIIFKNSFCFICNPSFHDDDYVAKCNKTLMWYPYDKALIASCSRFPYIPAKYPYKNIYCYICNINQSIPSNYMDANVIVNKSKEEKQNVYEIKVMKLNEIYHRTFFSIWIGNYTSNEYVQDEKKIDIFSNFEKSHNINLTNLLIKRVALKPVPLCYYQSSVYGSNLTVNSTFLPFLKKCEKSCHQMDVWCELQCCYDSSITNSVACFDIGDNMQNLMIDGCRRQTVHERMPYEYLCNSRVEKDTILSYVPTIFDFADIVYKNSFCAICNDIRDRYTIHNSLTSLGFYKIVAKCFRYVVFDNFVFLHELMQVFNHAGCDISYHHPTGKGKKCNTVNKIRKCNITGNWITLDQDIQWACENDDALAYNDFDVEEHYYNTYCKLCNPKWKQPSLFKTCNLSGKWLIYNAYIKQACEIFPETYINHPYKNFFCRLCNTDVVFDDLTMHLDDKHSKLHLLKPHVPVTINKYPSLRNIFSLAAYSEAKLSHSDEHKCLENQIYDAFKDICKNITCYPGKILQNSSCISLLSITNNLRYVLSFRATGFIHNQSYVQDILPYYEDALLGSLNDILGKENYIVEELYLLTNAACYHRETLTSLNQKEEIEILVYGKVFVEGQVSRLQTEEMLLSLTHRSLNITVGNEILRYHHERVPHTIAVPTLFHEMDYEASCRRHVINDSIDNDFRAVHVAPLLLCQQVMFDKHEYRLDWDRLQLMLVNYDERFTTDEFQLFKGGKASVCTKRIQLALMGKSHAMSSSISPLGILTMSCLLLSEICLALTFITYVVLKPLQTLPGKNNMGVITSLFMAQSLMLIQTHVQSIDQLCVVIGALSHFAWLSYFLWLSVCTFHMFRVFAGGMYRGSNSNKTFLKYCLFCVGIPLVTVLSAIGVSLVISEGQNTGYSSYRCFITDKIIFIATLLTPLTIVCISNIAFFSITIHKIRNTPKVQKSKDDTLQFIVYIKLFALTGITWSFQIIDSFLLLSFLSYVSIVFNGAQGLYIFICCVCNKHTLNMYTLKCFRKRKYDDTSSSINGTTVSSSL